MKTVKYFKSSPKNEIKRRRITSSLITLSMCKLRTQIISLIAMTRQCCQGSSLLSSISLTPAEPLPGFCSQQRQSSHEVESRDSGDPKETEQTGRRSGRKRERPSVPPITGHLPWLPSDSRAVSICWRIIMKCHRPQKRRGTRNANSLQFGMDMHCLPVQPAVSQMRVRYLSDLLH